MKTLQFTITPAPVEFSIQIHAFDAYKIFGYNCYFEDTVYGLDQDGITGFAQSLTKASSVFGEERDEVLSQIFPTGITQGKTITGDKRLKALKDKKLADPDLLYSLYLEKEQKTLNYVNNAFDITYIEACRRIFCLNGVQYFINLYKGSEARWKLDIEALHIHRRCYTPALAFL